MRTRIRGLASGGLAVFMSLVLVQSAFAISWGTTKALTSTTDASMWPGSLGASGSNLHVVYRQVDPDGRHVTYRRSTDGGATWKAPVEVSRPSATASARSSISVSAAAVDVVWVEGADLMTEARLVHRRSSNSGSTWGGFHVISPTSTSVVGFPTVASRGAVVAVAYSDWETGGVYFRRSTDGGATWKARIKLGSTTNDYWGDGSALEGLPDLAFGNGVLYAVWMSDKSTIRLRRSFDDGATWTGTGTLETKALQTPILRVAAAGSSAMVVFQYYVPGSNSYAAQVRSTDKGSHWTGRAMVSTGTNPAGAQDVIRAGAKWRVVYLQCLVAACDTGNALWYRESADGKSWSAASRFSNHLARPDPWAASMAYSSSGKTWIAWAGFKIGAADGDIYIRSGQ